MLEITKAKIVEWLQNEEDEFYIEQFRTRHEVSSESNNFYKVFSRLCEERVLKRLGRGLYRKIKKVEPVQWELADETIYYDFRWPAGHGDNSTFGFEELIAVSPGDLIVLGGVSNSGKSALALNILAENMDYQPCLLMGNEYTTMGNHPSPKFKRRLLAMDWAQWFDGNGRRKFTLLPVKRDFEDYMEAGKLNIADWVDFQGDWTITGKVLSAIKDAGAGGLTIACLQKKKGAALAMGADLTEHYADVYLMIDPMGQWESRLTVGKVKETKRGRVTGRMWAFEIIKGGSTLTNIREIERCRICKGHGYIIETRCDKCIGKGYVDKDDVPF